MELTVGITGKSMLSLRHIESSFTQYSPTLRHQPLLPVIAASHRISLTLHALLSSQRYELLPVCMPDTLSFAAVILVSM